MQSASIKVKYTFKGRDMRHKNKKVDSTST